MFSRPAFARYTGQTAADNSNINLFGQWRSLDVLGWEWYTVQEDKENDQNLLNRQGGAHPLGRASASNAGFSAVVSTDDYEEEEIPDLVAVSSVPSTDDSFEEEVPDLEVVSGADSAGGNESEAQSYSGYTNDEMDGAGFLYATGGGYEADRGSMFDDEDDDDDDSSGGGVVHDDSRACK